MLIGWWRADLVLLIGGRAGLVLLIGGEAGGLCFACRGGRAGGWLALLCSWGRLVGVVLPIGGRAGVVLLSAGRAGFVLLIGGWRADLVLLIGGAGGLYFACRGIGLALFAKKTWSSNATVLLYPQLILRLRVRVVILMCEFPVPTRSLLLNVRVTTYSC